MPNLNNLDDSLKYFQIERTYLRIEHNLHNFNKVQFVKMIKIKKEMKFLKNKKIILI
jgi:hypothetical protein